VRESPRLRPKHTRTGDPSLHRRYPASSVLWTPPTPTSARLLQGGFDVKPVREPDAGNPHVRFG